MIDKIIDKIFGGIIKKLNDLSSEIVGLILALNNRAKKENEDLSLAFMRKVLGSIDLTNIPEITHPDHEDKKEYLAKITSVVFPIVESRIKTLINHQKDFIANEASCMDQIWFARGSINGLSLVLESFEKDRSEFNDMSKPKENIERGTSFDSVVQ
jgi:hypothetical protein